MIKSFLSDRCKEVILGSLLGDGSLKIYPPYKNARFSFRHSINQKEYFFWKAEQLKEITSKSYYWKSKKFDGLGGEKLRFQSLALESLTGLYDLTNDKGKLCIRRKWLNMLSPLSLAIWWLDDGSLIVNGRRGVLCTDSFTMEGQKILAQYLLKVWDVNMHIGKISRDWKGKHIEYYRLWIRSSEELRKLMRIILPHIKVPQMLPKVTLLYKNIELQQRWISEISKLTGFPENLVQKYTDEKKKRWKSFRE